MTADPTRPLPLPRFLDLHLLHSLPPHCINRGDDGLPKSAVFGGVPRARVSSQSWKRATRTAFAGLLDPAELGVRTRRLVQALAETLARHRPDLDATVREQAAAATLTAAGLTLEVPRRGKDDAIPQARALAFLSTAQLDALAALAAASADLGDPAAYFKDKDTAGRARDCASSQHSVDIALFGRMVAETPALTVDAACQVGHAIGVAPLENEFDYYTALDDLAVADPTAADAAMIGTTGFNSATFYRYATINLPALQANLGTGLREDQPPRTPTAKAVAAFITAFTRSMPTGRSNAFAPHTLPSLVLAQWRTAPMSYSGAFEEPVAADAKGGILRLASIALASHARELQDAYGAAERSWLLRVGTATDAAQDLGERVARIEDLAQSVATTITGGEHAA